MDSKGKLKIDIEKLISDSVIEADKKACLKKVFMRLADYETDLLGELKQIVVKEEQGFNLKTMAELLQNADEDFTTTRWDKLWNVETVLTKRSDVEDNKVNGLNLIDDQNSVFFNNIDMDDDIKKNEETGPLQQFFLDCSYEKIEGYCQKRYKGILKNTGESFYYSLTPNHRLIEAEKILFETAKLYKINRPIIYAPYSRHAVDIRIEDITDENQFWQDKPDFRLNENNLAKVLITDCVLMWNIDIERIDGVRYHLAPNEREMSYIYDNYDEIEANQFIYPEDEIEAIFKLPDRIRIYAAKELGTSCKMITINKIDDDDIKGKVYKNIYNDHQFINIERIRTKRDIESVLSRFKTNYMSCSYLSCIAPDKKEEGTKIDRYSKDDRYNEDKNQLYYARRLKLPICNLLFETDGSPQLLTDYANYVIHYLKNKYPEFNWAGVQK